MDIEANKADTENAHYPMPFGLCVFVTIWILGCFALIGSGINFLVQSAAMDPSEDFFSLGKVCNITKVRHPVGQEREAKKDRQGRKKESSFQMAAWILTSTGSPSEGVSRKVAEKQGRSD